MKGQASEGKRQQGPLKQFDFGTLFFAHTPEHRGLQPSYNGPNCWLMPSLTWVKKLLP